MTLTPPLIAHSFGLKRVAVGAYFGQLDLFGEGAVGRFSEAVEHDTHGRPDVAGGLYWECIETEDRIADAFCNLAVISYEAGDEVLAREYLADALINEPDHGVAHYNVGTLALFRGENQLAILHYREVLQEAQTLPDAPAISPGARLDARVIFPSARMNLAVALAQEGNYSGSLVELEHLSAQSRPSAEKVRPLVEIVKGMQASQLPLQEEVERLISALKQAKQRTTVRSGQMRSKEFRSIATAIQALQKLVS